MPSAETNPGVSRCRGLSRLTPVLLLTALHISPATAAETPQPQPARVPRIAAVVSSYYHNSHADMIVSRLLQTYTLDGKGDSPKLELVSLYTDQVPDKDTSRRLAKQHGFRICRTATEALTLGTGELAVDGVLLIIEHGEYPVSKTGQIIYPKRPLFTEIANVMEKSGRSVPVFIDKHLADNWEDAHWIYQRARELKIPLMAGSSLPGLWRYPAVDLKRDAKLKEVVAVSYHTLDGYGFHGLEMLQAIVERRHGGETGVKSVQCLEGEQVIAARDAGVFDMALLKAALSRMKEFPLKPNADLEAMLRKSVLWVIDYRDGLRASVITFRPPVVEWTIAWRTEEEPGKISSTVFWTQEARPFMHFSFLVQGIEKMMHTGEPTWPVERTLMTSGLLDALLISRLQGGKKLAMPQLDIDYRSGWNWKAPPPPPPGRPIPGQ